MAYFKYLPKLLYSNSNKDQNYKLVSNLLAKSVFLSDILENASLYYPYDVQEGEKPEDVSLKFYNDQGKHWIIMMSNDVIDPNYDWVMETRIFDKYINSKYSSLTIQLNQSESYPLEYSVGEAVYQGSSIDSSSATGTVAAYNYTDKILQVKFPDEIFVNTLNVSSAATAQTHSIVSITSNDDGLSWASNTTYHYVITETKYNSYDKTNVVDKYKISALNYNHSTDTVINRDLSNSTQSYELNDGTTLTIKKETQGMSYYDYEWQLNENRRHIRIIKPEYISLIENEFIKLMSQ